jgi:hypothetical protein
LEDQPEIGAPILEGSWGNTTTTVTHVSGMDKPEFGAGEGIRTLDPNLGNGRHQ